MKNNFTLILIFVFGIYFSQKTLIPFRDGDLWGFSDENGVMKISAKYDSATIFSRLNTSNMAIVGKNGKFGAVDESGEEIIPLIYKKIEFLRKESNYEPRSESLFAENADGSQTLYSGGNKILDNLQKIKIIAGNNTLVQKSYKLGLYDDSGKEILPVIYNQIDYVDVENSREDITYRISSDDETKLLTIQSEEKQYTSVQDGPRFPSPGPNKESENAKLEFTKCVYKQFCIYKKQKKFGYMNLGTNAKTSPEYDEMVMNETDFGVFAVGSKDGKQTLLNENADVVVPPVNAKIRAGENYAEINEGEKSGFYFYKEKKYTAPKFKKIENLNYRVSSEYAENGLQLIRIYNDNPKKWFYIGSNGVVFSNLNK